MDALSPRLKDAHDKWSHARTLVIHVARELAADFGSKEKQHELELVLLIEARARDGFKAALEEEDH